MVKRKKKESIIVDTALANKITDERIIAGLKNSSHDGPSKTDPDVQATWKNLSVIANENLKNTGNMYGSANVYGLPPEELKQYEGRTMIMGPDAPHYMIPSTVATVIGTEAGASSVGKVIVSDVTTADIIYNESVVKTSQSVSKQNPVDYDNSAKTKPSNKSTSVGKTNISYQNGSIYESEINFDPNLAYQYTHYLSHDENQMLPAQSTESMANMGSEAIKYELAQYRVGDAYQYDTRPFNFINRFKLSTSEGLSTKSFLFMSKPDLNIYKSDGVMNNSMRLIPIFKYIARNPDIGGAICDSLEYNDTMSMDTPWQSIITNSAKTYNIQDRSIDTLELGESFHGSKIMYGKNSFKNRTAGTASIQFADKRSLPLYWLIKFWTEYIHNVHLGYIAPKTKYIQNAILDYAVSAYYIVTDETMENIIYWEKLTGLFPTSCPDSIFESTGESERDLKYTIDFAYSVRSPLNPAHLFEINRMYMKGAINTSSSPNLPEPNYSVTYMNDELINTPLSRLSAYYESKTKDPLEILANEQAHATDVNSALYKYMYDTVSVSGYNFDILPNYITELGTHGIPYVKGPYIVPAPGANYGKFLLKWV